VIRLRSGANAFADSEWNLTKLTSGGAVVAPAPSSIAEHTIPNWNPRVSIQLELRSETLSIRSRLASNLPPLRQLPSPTN